MRIAIAGGNGFIGREITRQLLAADHEVVWLSNHPGSRPAPEGVREVALDPASQSGSTAAEIRHAEALVNASGYPIARRWTSKRRDLIVRSRVDLTRCLVDRVAEAALDRSGPRVFVCASATGIYGDRGDEVLTEESATGGDWLADIVVAWEAEAMRAARARVRVVTIRTGIVLGDEGVLPKMELATRMFAGGPIGSGRQWVPWIHRCDIGGLYRFAAENDVAAGPLNACAPEPVRMRELSAALGRVLGRPSWLPVPALALRITLGQVAPYTLASLRMSARRALDLGFTFRYPEVESALRDLLG